MSALEHALDLFVIPIHDGLRLHALFHGLHENGRAVLVGSADEDYVAPLQPLVANVEVRRQVRPRDVPDVQRAIGVRKRGGDEDRRVGHVGSLGEPGSYGGGLVW